MDKQCEELKSLLTDELTIHSECVKIAAEMNKALKEKNVEGVQILTERYDNCIGQIETLEARRLELCDSIARALKQGNRHMNLQNLIGTMPEEDRKYFFGLRTSLKRKIDDLAKINISNQLLLNESLEVIKKNFELFSQIQNRFAGYKQCGTMDKKSVKKNIINKIA